MKNNIINLDEMTDTRELLYAKPPKVMIFFIYLIVSMFVIAFIFIWFGEIDINVKARAIIRPEGTISVVKNIVSGNIRQIFYKESMSVIKGDVLFSIDSKQYEMEYENLESQLSKLEKEKDNINLLEKSILNRKNYFNINDIEYFNKYLVYEYQHENLKLEYLKAEKDYTVNNGYTSGSISKMDLENYERKTKLTELSLKKYESENIVNIKSSLESINKQILDLKEQIAKINETLDYCRVISPINGVIQVIERFNTGDYVSGNTSVLKIIPIESSKLSSEIMVQNRDIAKIKEGDSISYKFDSYSQNEYGNLSGKILNIPDDVMSFQNSVNQNNSEILYTVIGSLDSISLKDKKGKILEIKNGMISNASIIVKKKKILFYLLEKLDFISS
jgi:membrane fusion protein, peptide pheromone/bacteriocin exporter